MLNTLNRLSWNGFDTEWRITQRLGREGLNPSRKTSAGAIEASATSAFQAL